MIDSRILEELRRLNDQGVVSGCFRCPICERSNKFSVTFRDGLALYCCHRASCGVRGVYAIAGAGNAREGRRVAAFTPRPLLADFRLPQEGEYWHDYLRLRLPPGSAVDVFCLEHGFRVLVDDPTTCVWYIHNLGREHLGHITRTQDKRIKSWIISPSPRYAAFPKNPAYPVVIVEDCMSAALWPGDGIALLGTNLSREAAAEIARLIPDQGIYVALDVDAFRETSRIVERLRAVGALTHILPLTRDIKDMDPVARWTLFRGLT